jgi:hypothetical protein
MKIYLFSPDTGLYQGEDYWDPAPMADSNEELASGATTIAPPAHRRGEVPVYLATERRWVVHELLPLQVLAALRNREENP